MILLPRLIFQGATPNIEFGFAGGSALVPGDNETLFGFCHTSGGLYTAGDVVYDDGTTTLSSFKIPLQRQLPLVMRLSALYR